MVENRMHGLTGETCRPDFALGRRKDDRFLPVVETALRRPSAGTRLGVRPPVRPPGEGPHWHAGGADSRRMSKQRTEDGANESTSLADRRWRQEDAEKVLAAREESGCRSRNLLASKE